MRTNIHAYTETSNYQNYPAYVSLNREANGEYTLSVRSRDETVTSSITLTRDQIAGMAFDIGRHMDANK